MLTCLVPVLATFHIQNVLKLKNNFDVKGLNRVGSLLNLCAHADTSPIDTKVKTFLDPPSNCIPVQEHPAP